MIRWRLPSQVSGTSPIHVLVTFIHLYEDALVEKCGYGGALPYWDWALDWRDIRQSPVFDAAHGFGGNGNLHAESSVGGGYCVTDGPFAYLEVLRYDTEYQPHCLSRGMLRGQLLADLCSVDIRPAAIAQVLGKNTFEEFMHDLEEGPHIGISTGIRGDWIKFTAPYDPVWFLHHSQIDRLWWLWQQSSAGRLREYNGRSNNLTSAKATIFDELDFGGFTESVQVAEILGTESEKLCYRYE